MVSELNNSQGEFPDKTDLASVGLMSVQLVHDLRNPLATIWNVVNYLKRTIKPEDAQLTSPLELIAEEIDACNQMIQHFLNTLQRKPLCREKVNLSEILRKAFQRLSMKHPVGCRFQADADDCIAEIDPIQFRRVIDNLLTNAVEACGTEGNIEIRLTHQGDFVRILVADNGPGIPAKVRCQIFEQGFTTKVQGSGLGLLISREILEQHGGTLKLLENSEVSCSGTTFEMMLPIVAPESHDDFQANSDSSRIQKNQSL